MSYWSVVVNMRLYFTFYNAVMSTANIILVRAQEAAWEPPLQVDL